MSIIDILLSIFLPPLAVALRKGIGGDFLINLLLTFLGGLPGMIHALWLLSKNE